MNIFKFFKKKNPIYTKLVSQTVHTLYQFHIKFHLESIESIYHLSIFYNLNITFNYWLISKTINIRGNFIWKCHLCPWYSCTDIVFSFFSVIITYEVTSCIFVLICFNCSNSLVSFAFMLHQYIRWYNPMWVNREAINNSHHDKTIILENIVILLTSIWFYSLVPLYS